MANFTPTAVSKSSNFITGPSGDQTNDVLSDLLANRTEVYGKLTNIADEFYGATPPANPNVGRKWRCSTTAGSYVANTTYRWNGSAWAVDVASTVNVPQRNCILEGPVSATGVPILFSAGTGLACDLKATVRISFANGFVATVGASDYYASITSDAAGFWASLPINSTVYLYFDRDSSGVVTGGYSVLAPVYQAFAPTHNSGLHWYDTNSQKMFISDGSAWNQCYRVFVGTATTDADSVTAVAVNVNESIEVIKSADIITKGPWVDVRAFGAKGDVIVVTGTTSIAAGSTALTASGATFTAEDVGKNIAVQSAGALVPGVITYEITTAALATDTVDIEGETFTCVASGATGDQFNVGSSADDQAASLVTAINANATLSALYTATATGATVTLTEKTANGGNTPGIASTTGEIQVLTDCVTVSGVAELETTIAAYVSATQVTLTVAATTAIVGASKRVMYGTDDTAAFNLAIAAMTNNSKLLIPYGETGKYFVENLVINKNDAEIVCNGTLVPLLTSSAEVMRLTGLRATGTININTGADWFRNTGKALVLYNANECLVNVISASGMNTGIEVIGDDAGCSYNKLFINRCYDNKISIKTSGINNGWSNENTFYGGRYSNGNAKANYIGCVIFDIGDNDYWVADSNHFIHPSVEGAGKLAIIRGKGHGLENVRIELKDYEYTTTYNNANGYASFIQNGVIEFASGSSANYVSFLYSTFTASGYKTTTFAGVTRSSANTFVLSTADGDLTGLFNNSKRINLVYSDASKIDSVVVSASYAAGQTTIRVINDDTAKTLTGIETLYYVDNGGNNIVTAQNPGKTAAGSALSRETLILRPNGSKIPAITFLDASSASDFVFTVNYLGSQRAYLTAGGTLYLNGTSITGGTAAPASGTYVRGAIVFNIGATGPLCWRCTTGGTPGTWASYGVAGMVQGATVPDAAGATPTAAEFKALLDSLRTAKLIAT